MSCGHTSRISRGFTKSHTSRVFASRRSAPLPQPAAALRSQAAFCRAIFGVRSLRVGRLRYERRFPPTMAYSAESSPKSAFTK